MSLSPFVSFQSRFVTYLLTYPRTKIKNWNQKNMKECDKRKSHISSRSIYFLIILDTLLLRPSLHFTPLHYTCRHVTSSHLNFTQLHFTTLSFGLIPFKFPTAHFTSQRSPHLPVLTPEVFLLGDPESRQTTTSRKYRNDAIVHT